MCGISGIINKNGDTIENNEIAEINRLIAHRGPDDEGVYFGDGFAFGHRRLSILDLSPEGHQPMSFADRHVITYNGEIYNYLEIRGELEAKGYTFHSQTDTEVILAAYDKWGEACVERFNGMWSFALYDKERQIIFCSRDRFGIKPFYYTETDEIFVFGSEIKQLLSIYPERYVNKKILMEYLLLGYEDHTEETFFENIVKLPASHNLIYDLKTHLHRLHRYYQIHIDPASAELDESTSVLNYRGTLTSAIKLRLRSDVQVGVCLSGGLDSSSIAAIAAPLYSAKMSAVHAKSTEAATDESRFARDVADYCALDLNVIEPGIKEVHRCLQDVVYTQEEPFGGLSVVMQYLVFEKAHAIGCKVMLDGQGGDETLMGYERYYPAFIAGLKGPSKLLGIIESSKNSGLGFYKMLKYFIYFTHPQIRLRMLKKRMPFIKKDFFQYVDSNILKTAADNYKNFLALQEQEICATQMPHLLRYEDKNSMRHSVETRLPFIDFSNLERALSTNDRFKINGGWTKYILRKAIDPFLPEHVVWRKKKVGFEAPASAWLRQLAPLMQEAVFASGIVGVVCGHFDFETLDEKTQWKLYNIAAWEKIYDVKIK